MLSCADFPPLPPLTLPTQHRRGGVPEASWKKDLPSQGGPSELWLGIPPRGGGGGGGIGCFEIAPLGGCISSGICFFYRSRVAVMKY